MKGGRGCPRGRECREERWWPRRRPWGRREMREWAVERDEVGQLKSVIEMTLRDSPKRRSWEAARTSACDAWRSQPCICTRKEEESALIPLHQTESYSPLSQDGQVLALLDGEQVGHARLEPDARGVLDGKDGRELGEDEDRVLDVHVLARFERSDEALQPRGKVSSPSLLSA